MMRLQVLWLLAACFFSLPTNAQGKATVTVVAVGDVLLDRGVRRDIQRFGLAYPFSATSKVLSDADVSFANLECPLAARSKKIRKTVSFRADPNAAQCLGQGGIDIVSLANNHALDCGRAGLLETFKALQRHKVLWCGAGHNRRASETATRVTINGVRLAFVAFSEFMPTSLMPHNNKPSIAPASPDSIRRVVKAARAAADVVTVSFHWGVEGASRPRAHQKEWAHLAVQWGADLVLGHHPHVLQGMEIVPRKSAWGGTERRALIAYSLGNFVFDVPRHFDPQTAQSIVLRCTFNRQGLLAAEVTPVMIAGTRPRLAKGRQATTIVHRLRELSGELGTRLSGSNIVINGQ